ncbi:MAG: SpoIIE family protein phosphatase [Bacteroidota bacterium]|nr:SpoIIE family protein phosphatase [Bacteroidota bacterium]
MALTKRNYQQLYIFVAILSWVFLATTDAFSIFSDMQLNNSYWYYAFRHFLLSVVIISTFFFYKLTIGGFEGQGFNDLLWKCFITGLIATLILIGNEFIGNILMSIFPEKDFIVINIFYHITIATTILFVSVVFFTFKKMILYQKSKETANLWNIFEYLIYISILFNFLNINNKDILFSLAAIPIMVMAFILSLNLRWIAYLNFSQKWLSILFLIILLFFDFLFLFNIWKDSEESALITDLANNLFVLSILAFIGIYSLFSVLVLLFNLPTSSVFEQKFGEVVNLQKLSSSAQMGKTEDEVYGILIDSCTGTFVANAAALEMLDESGNPKSIIYKNLDKSRFYTLKTFLRKNNLKVDNDYLLIEDVNKIKNSPDANVRYIQSMLAIPLINYGEKLGTIFIFSDIKNGFDKELISIVSAYVNQASVSISNYRLVYQAVQNARYKEELEIAKRVQEKLLPKSIINDSWIEMATFTESPDEVGGDYFDYYKSDEGIYSMAIGDVSGKGTSASFHMANLKGIFHSLVQFNLEPISFLEKANNALSVSLAKSSFATFSLIQFDFVKKTYRTARAGHCPILHYSASSKSASYIEPKGIGLGIIRNHSFGAMIEPFSASFASGDIFVGFTDGIVEANNEADEEFGYERIKNLIERHAHLAPEDLVNEFAKILHEYCGSVRINDDHTILIVRIK